MICAECRIEEAQPGLKYCSLQCANNAGETMDGDSQMFCPYCRKKLFNEKAVRQHMMAKHKNRRFDDAPIGNEPGELD